MKIATIIAATSLGLLAMMAVPKARADEWNKKTVFTFSGPVEIPGQVLNAGTYVFKLVDSQADRHIVQVFSKDEKHLFATILAIPDYRLQPKGHTILTFEERTAGAPEAVKAWFYPGDNYGDEFVYPKVRAAELARQNSQPVPSHELAANPAPSTPPPAPAMNQMKKAPLKMQQPAGEETEVTQVYIAPAQVAQNNPPPQPTPAPTPAPQKLPTTASSLPLIGLLGLFFVIAGLILSFIQRRLT